MPKEHNGKLLCRALRAYDCPGMMKSADTNTTVFFVEFSKYLFELRKGKKRWEASIGEWRSRSGRKDARHISYMKLKI